MNAQTHPLTAQPTATPADVRVDTPFVAATKRNYPLARTEMEKAYPNAAPHLRECVTRAYAELLASDEVSGRVKERGL